MRKSYLLLVICVFMFSSILIIHPNSGSANTESSQTVNTDYLRIRSNPSTNSAIIGVLYKNQQVQVVESQAGWSKIQYQGMNGWVSSQYLESKSTNIHSKGYSTVSSLNIRGKASKDSMKIGSLTKGAAVNIVSERDGWYYIESESGNGWVAKEYIASQAPNETANVSGTNSITLRTNANLRTGPGTEFDSLFLGQAGTTYNTIGASGNWLQVQLSNGQTAWVASWLTKQAQDTPAANKAATSKGIQGKTIVLDAGHGGRDPGKIGASYLEKDLTLSTVMQTASLLQSVGVNVIYTRSQDTYLALEDRVRISQMNNADAFISFHFNAAYENSSGIMSFYYSPSKDRDLATSIQSELVNQTGLPNAGVHFGDFHVSRENNSPAVLLELGFLSNPSEESIVSTEGFRQQVARGIVQGVTNYFNQ